MAKRNSENNRIYSQRKVTGRTKRKRFLIVCEGKATEPNYFKCFQELGKNTQTATIQIEDLGAVGITVVKKAKKLKEQGNYENDEVWCVFDRDLKQENNNQQNFNEAIKLAIEYELNLAISNDAFELWYLLHYEYYESETHRSTYKKMLSAKTRLGEKYEKNSQNMYEKLQDKQSNAIKYAKQLWLNHCNLDKVVDPNNLTIQERIKIHNINPSTTVYQLVDKLNEVIFRDQNK